MTKIGIIVAGFLEKGSGFGRGRGFASTICLEMDVHRPPQAGWRRGHPAPLAKLPAGGLRQSLSAGAGDDGDDQGVEGQDDRAERGLVPVEQSEGPAQGEKPDGHGKRGYEKLHRASDAHHTP